MTPAAARADAVPAPLPARTDPARRPGLPARQTSLILGPVDTAPGTARATLRAALAGWGLSPLADTAELVASELVTNAITASRAAAPGGTEPRPVTFWVTARNGELLIGVTDPDPAPPPRDQAPPGSLEESGRGLVLVAALSRRWGWHPAPGGGKHVWAALTGETR